MEILESLDQRVEGLVNQNRDLQLERDSLRKALDDSERQREDLAEQISSQDDNRAEIRNRIQAIIDKIERMESDSEQ
jgi:regulator of replication initiation timing